MPRSIRSLLAVSGLFGLLALLSSHAAAAPADAGTTSAPDAPPIVTFETRLGAIVIELDPVKAPLSSDNFLQYARSGFYDGTLFHRVISGFMIQGGGFEKGMVQKATRPPIQNESANGLRNQRGSIAMARTAAPDSATAQFYINLVDNPALDGSATRPGYAVFGRVIRGMEVVDAIAKADTHSLGAWQDVPVEDVTIAATRVNPAQAE